MIAAMMCFLSPITRSGNIVVPRYRRSVKSHTNEDVKNYYQGHRDGEEHHEWQLKGIGDVNVFQATDREFVDDVTILILPM